MSVEVQKLKFSDVEICLKPTTEDLAIARRLLELFEQHFLKPKAVRKREEGLEPIDVKVLAAFKGREKRFMEVVRDLGLNKHRTLRVLNRLIRKGRIVKKKRGLYSLSEAKA